MSFDLESMLENFFSSSPTPEENKLECLPPDKFFSGGLNICEVRPESTQVSEQHYGSFRY